MSSLGLTYQQSAVFRVYAGLWTRGIAKVIDCSLLAACFLPFDIFSRTSFVIQRGGSESTFRETAALLVTFCLYSALMESCRLQATLGKRMTGIVVQGLEGQRIDFVHALARSALQIVSLGYLFGGFTKRKQALHDLVVDTVVVPATL